MSILTSISGKSHCTFHLYPFFFYSPFLFYCSNDVSMQESRSSPVKNSCLLVDTTRCNRDRHCALKTTSYHQLNTVVPWFKEWNIRNDFLPPSCGYRLSFLILDLGNKERVSKKCSLLHLYSTFTRWKKKSLCSTCFRKYFIHFESECHISVSSCLCFYLLWSVVIHLSVTFIF